MVVGDETFSPCFRRVEADGDRQALRDLVGQNFMYTLPGGTANHEPYRVVGVTPAIGADGGGQVWGAPEWYAALGLDIHRATKHEKKLLVVLERDTAIQLVRTTGRAAWQHLVNEPTTGAAVNSEGELVLGSHVSVCLGVDPASGRRYSSMAERTGSFTAHAERRWYAAVITGYDRSRFDDHAYHIVLEADGHAGRQGQT